MVGSQAIAAGQGVAEKVAALAYDNANNALGFAKDSQRQSGDLASQALGLTTTTNQDAFSLVRSALGFAGDSLTKATNAAGDASQLAARAFDGSIQTAAGNRTIATVGLVIAGTVVAIFLFKQKG